MIHLRLSEELKAKGKSLYWLINQTGRSYQSLRNLMKDDLTSIHFDTLDLLCKTLDCTPGDLLELVDDDKKEEKDE